MRPKETSNKSFGILFFFIFLAIGIWPLLNSGEPRLWSLFFAFIFLVLGLLDSKILKPIKFINLKIKNT